MIENKFTKTIEKNKYEILIKDEIKYLPLSANTKRQLTITFNQIGMVVCLPLYSEKKLIGFLALDEKEKSTPYSKEEINELLSLKEALSICFMNILIGKNLQEENDIMKTILQEKTREINRQLKQIKTLSTKQADFIAISAHELRTPLTIAMLKLELLSHDPKLAPRLKETDEALKRLHVLIQKFFAVQKYDLNKVLLQSIKINAHEFFNDLHMHFGPLIKKAGIKFEFKNNIPQKTNFVIDAFQVQQVFQNLFDNALRFTPKEGIIKLETKATPKNIEACVSDSGPGIPSKDQKHIFEKFKSDPKLKGKGIGLGLYLCKKIVHLHKGKLWVKSSDLGGAHFCIRLPKK